MDPFVQWKKRRGKSTERRRSAAATRVVINIIERRHRKREESPRVPILPGHLNNNKSCASSWLLILITGHLYYCTPISWHGYQRRLNARARRYNTTLRIHLAESESGTRIRSWVSLLRKRRKKKEREKRAHVYLFCQDI